MLWLRSQFPDYPFKAVKEYAQHVDTPRVRVACLAIEDEKEQRRWFGLNLGGKGYLPVALIVENASAEDGLVLRINNIRASSGSATPQALDGSKQNVANSKVLPIASVAPMPYGLAASLALARAKDVAYNLALK